MKDVRMLQKSEHVARILPRFGMLLCASTSAFTHEMCILAIVMPSLQIDKSAFSDHFSILNNYFMFYVQESRHATSLT